MSNSQEQEKAQGSAGSRDAAYWASSVDRMDVGQLPPDAINLNVHGRQPLSPLQGFGQMWQKTYSIRLSGASASPTDVIRTWKQHFPEFWPEGNRFYGPLTGIAPGEVAVLNVAVTGGLKLSTGVRVIYADDESFTFMTPEGHMFAGWITFSAFEEADETAIQVQALIRANDPLYEASFRLGFGHKAEDTFWHATLKNLAARFGVNGVAVTQQNVCVDPRVQWSEAKNIWYNAGIRSTLYMIGAPLRWLMGKGRRKQ